MNTEDLLKKWARKHGKNINNILHRFKKLTILEKMMFLDEVKHERKNS